jgi:hypothetical protein
MDTATFNGIFWISITANLISLIIGLVKICSKSKCDNVELCCIKIHRNVQLEFEESKIEMEKKTETKESV